MKNTKITILFKLERITLMYSLYPFWVSKYRDEFDFTTDWNWVLNKDKNQYIFLARCFSGIPKTKRLELLQQLKQKYEKVFLFDDNDGSESHYLDLLPHLDKYYKKQVFKDKSLYTQPLYGNRIFSDYYHKTFGIEELSPKDPLPELENVKDLEKLSVLWNLGIGQYPLSKLRNLIALKGVGIFGKNLMSNIFTSKPQFSNFLLPSINKCQARFTHQNFRTSVGFQRKLFNETLKQHPRFLTGKIPPTLYKKELSQVQAVFSPFGWGEICFRDFEAILSGAVLIKPDVSHIETWPDIFIPNETYIPVKWDALDIIEKTEILFQNPSQMKLIRNNAWTNLQSAYSNLEDRVVSIINDFGIS